MKRRTGDDVRVMWSTVGRAATGLPVSRTIQFRAAVDARPEIGPADATNIADTSVRTVMSESGLTPGGSDQRISADTVDNSSATDAPPDISAEFKSEMEALRSFYAARIGAARRSMTGHQFAAFLQALIGEQTVARRALAERWQAAGQKQRDEQPQRPSTKLIPQKGNHPR